MRDLNTLDYLDFLSKTFVWGFGASVLYRVTCFKYTHGVSDYQSKILFWVLVAVFILAGTALTVRKRRNYVSLVVNTALPLTVYTVVSTFRYIPTFYTVALSVAAVLSAVYFSLVVLKKVKNIKYKRLIIFKRVNFALLGMRTIIFALLFAVTVPVCSRICLGYGLVSADVGSGITETDESEWTVRDHSETVVMLHEEKWYSLSVKEKMTVLETVKEIEMKDFGITYDVYLCAEPLDGNTLGSYNHQERRITIDTEHLKSSEPRSVLRTLLHECMHAYQHRCAEVYDQIDEEYKNMPLFRDAARYKNNFDNYVRSEDDDFGYYIQTVEVSAREYAEAATEDYYVYIAEFMNEGGEAVG